MQAYQEFTGSLLHIWENANMSVLVENGQIHDGGGTADVFQQSRRYLKTRGSGREGEQGHN